MRGNIIHSVIYSFNNYSLSTYDVQGTVPGNKNAAVEEKTSLEPQGVYIQEYWEETIKISKIYNRLDGDKC